MKKKTFFANCKHSTLFYEFPVTVFLYAFLRGIWRHLHFRRNHTKTHTFRHICMDLLMIFDTIYENLSYLEGLLAGCCVLGGLAGLGGLVPWLPPGSLLGAFWEPSGSPGCLLGASLEGLFALHLPWYLFPGDNFAWYLPWYPFPGDNFACVFTVVSFPWGQFCMRIYRGILSRGTILHAYLP